MASPVQTAPRAIRRRRRARGEARPPLPLPMRIVVSVALPIILILLWQWTTTTSPSPFFPTPLAIVTNSYYLFLNGPASQLFFSDAFLHDGLPTILRMLAGYGIAIVSGIVIGTLIGLLRLFREVVSPVVEFLRSVPAAAVLPLFVILLGGGDGMRIAFIAYGTAWFIIINTANGVGSIHPTVLMMGKSFRVSRPKQLFTLILPGAMPQIFSGIRIASGAALIFAVISEFILASDGIGYQLVITQQRFQLLNMWSWVLLVAILGLLFNAIIGLIESRVLAWHRLYRG
jgi:ABC-type nitrate/sulfonate/bicarbonate transport system permease component